MASKTSDLLLCRDSKRLLGSRTLSGYACSSSVTCPGTWNHRPQSSLLYPRAPTPHAGFLPFPHLGGETEALGGGAAPEGITLRGRTPGGTLLARLCPGCEPTNKPQRSRTLRFPTTENGANQVPV